MFLGLVDVVDNVLSRDIVFVDRILSEKDGVRETVLKIVREIIRGSGEAIRLIHLGEYGRAGERIKEVHMYVVRVKEVLHDHPDLYYSGLVYNGFSEYVEAVTTYKLIVENNMPSYEELGVPYIPYLQGLGDVVGELRRHVLTLLNKGEVEEAEKYLEVMEHIYLWLRKINYPEALTPGLRHKVDVARRLIEDTKTLLINTRNAITLSNNISRFLREIREK